MLGHRSGNLALNGEYILQFAVIRLRPKRAPVGGIENAGWRVVYNSEPSKLTGRRGNPGDVYSIGLQIGDDGAVSDSIVGSPAYDAGISSGMKVIGINGRLYTHDRLEDAIKASPDGQQPLAITVINDDYIRTFNINYHGGPRYPHLERYPDRPDYLDDLIKPRAAGSHVTSATSSSRNSWCFARRARS